MLVPASTILTLQFVQFMEKLQQQKTLSQRKHHVAERGQRKARLRKAGGPQACNTYQDNICMLKHTDCENQCNMDS